VESGGTGVMEGKLGKGENGLLFEQVGTSGCVAPEVFSGEGYGLPADVFSYGVLAWTVLAGGGVVGSPTPTPTNPLAGLEPTAALTAMQGGLRPPLDPVDHPVGPVRDLIQACWGTEQGNRPTFEQIAQMLDDILANTRIRRMSG
jgi:serine/threonine protein kinase